MAILFVASFSNYHNRKKNFNLSLQKDVEICLTVIHNFYATLLMWSSKHYFLLICKRFEKLVKLLGSTIVCNITVISPIWAGLLSFFSNFPPQTIKGLRQVDVCGGLAGCCFKT